jgi:L-alanine-DL-glutamate epimerase-like enolase superfamily enzyme
MAKIERIELRMVDLPPKVKRTDAIQSFVSQETPIVSITDSDGAVGVGYSYTIGAGGSSVMRLLSDHLAPRGGITPWLKVAHLAETFDAPICPHFLMELHVSLACAVPNDRYVEYIPQLDDLTTEGMTVEAGMAVAPQVSGLGIAWDWDAIRRRSVAEFTKTISN